MPTVKLDDAVTESTKIDSLTSAYPESVEVRDGTIAALAYPWFLLLGAGRNHGRFEVNPKRIAARLFSGIDDMTPDVVERCVERYEAQKLLVRYRDTDGRDLAALTRYRGWSTRRAASPAYADPPGCHDDGDVWNILDSNGDTAHDTVAVAPAPRRRKRDAPDTDATRALIDFYYQVWPTKGVRNPHSEKNRAAVHRTLSKGDDYDADDCKVAIFLARWGTKAWYRDHNHALEYLIRPGVIEQIISGNESFRLSHATTAEAHKLGLFGVLTKRGYGASDEARPTDDAMKRIMEQMRGKQPSL